LSARLTPVQRLPAPALRAAVWIASTLTAAIVLVALFADLSSFELRMSQPRALTEWAGTCLTAVTAILAAFELSVPGRSTRWAYLPLPTLLLWLGASGLGCLRNGLSLHGPHGFLGESAHCVVFILGISVPLAAGLFWMLRRARPIAPLPVAVLGTLGVAATAASVLQFFHPFDVTVIDLSLHLAAVATVLGVGIALRRPLLASD
jgi:hypothetical protein